MSAHFLHHPSVSILMTSESLCFYFTTQFRPVSIRNSAQFLHGFHDDVPGASSLDGPRAAPAPPRAPRAPRAPRGAPCARCHVPKGPSRVLGTAAAGGLS